jgi:hypothetical protein
MRRRISREEEWGLSAATSLLPEVYRSSDELQSWLCFGLSAEWLRE